MPKDADRDKFVALLESGGFNHQQAETLATVLYGGFDAEIEVNKVSTITCVVKAIGTPPGGPP